MVDFTGNPYLTDPRFQLSDDQMRQYRLGSLGSALTSFGAGIAQSGASGQPWMAGIAPGAAMASQSLGQEQARLAQMQDAAAKWAQMEDYRKAQEKELGLKTSQLEMDQELQKRLLNGGLPGFNMGQGGGVQTGPTGFGGGVNPNNIGNVRPPGASKGFQQPPDFDSGVGLTVSNAKAYPKAFNGGQPMNLVQIGEKWAPKGDGANDPHQWAVNVAQFSGLPLNQPINLDDPQTAAAFARGVHGAEKGAQAVKPLEAYVPGVMKGQQPGGYMRTPNPQVASGPPVIPQGGDAATGQPGTMPQPPQSAPQMPPGMPGPPPDASGMLPYMMSPRLAPLVTGALGQQKQQYEYQWKAYQAAQDAEKQRLANENAKVKIGSDGQPVLNSMLPQAEALSAGATERAKLAPDIVAGQSQAAGAKAAAEETAKANARIETYFPKNYQNMKPDEIRAHMQANNPLQLGELDAIGRMDVAPSELSNRPSGSMGLTKQETIAAVKVLYPDYSVRTAENHKDFIDYMRPNEQGGKTAGSIANAAQHVSDAADAYNALKNGQFPQGNKFFNEMATKFGWDKLTPFQTIQQAIGPEIAKVISAGSDNAVGEREAATEILASWNNPKTMAGVFDRVAGLMEKRRNTLYDQAEKAKVGRDFIDQSIGQYGTTALSGLRSAIKVPEDKNQSMQPKSADPMEGRTISAPGKPTLIRRGGQWVPQ